MTFVVFLGSRFIQRRTGLTVLNPILVSIVLLIGFLLVSGVPYETYAVSGEYIDFWLKPAVVALGVPLYRQLESIKKQLLPLLLAEIAGCVIGIVSVVVVAQLLGATKEVVVSLAPKAVTTPIAMEISSAVGGIPIRPAAHAIGTSAAMEKGYRYGAFSSLGLTLNGLFTALLTPFILSILGID